MDQRKFVALILGLFLALGTVGVASAATPQQLTTQQQNVTLGLIGSGTASRELLSVDIEYVGGQGFGESRVTFFGYNGRFSTDYIYQVGVGLSANFAFSYGYGWFNGRYGWFELQVSESSSRYWDWEFDFEPTSGNEVTVSGKGLFSLTRPTS